MGRPRLLEKKCSMCRLVFPATTEYFCLRNTEKGYLLSYCRKCQKEYKLINMPRELDLQRERRSQILNICITCKDIKGRKKQKCNECLKVQIWIPSVSDTPLKVKRVRANTCGVCKKAVGFHRQKCNDCIKANKKKNMVRERAIRKRRLKLQTPRWADLSAIREFYANRPVGMVVDHIIPLRGKNVSGLHVVENLQYLPKADNLRKSNHYSLSYRNMY